MNVYLLGNEVHALDPGIAETARQLGHASECLELPTNHEDLVPLLANKQGGIAVLPAIWEDLLCVKMAGEMAWIEPPMETVIAGSIPEPAHLVAAFNEGIAAYIPAPAEADQARRALNRAVRRWQARVGRLADADNPVQDSGTAERAMRDHYVGQALLKCADQGARPFGEEVRALIVSAAGAQRKQLETLLQRLGAEVRTTQTRKEALDALGKDRFTLIVSDGVLPDGDAPALAKSMRKACKGAVPRFVVWSSSPEKAAGFLNPENHIDDFILKPGPAWGLESVVPSLAAAVMAGSA